MTELKTIFTKQQLLKTPVIDSLKWDVNKTLKTGFIVDRSLMPRQLGQRTVIIDQPNSTLANCRRLSVAFIRPLFVPDGLWFHRWLDWFNPLACLFNDRGYWHKYNGYFEKFIHYIFCLDIVVIYVFYNFSTSFHVVEPC